MEGFRRVVRATEEAGFAAFEHLLRLKLAMLMPSLFSIYNLLHYFNFLGLSMSPAIILWFKIQKYFLSILLVLEIVRRNNINHGT